ncbi:MAG: SUMF1/EgtB/PvdO family nonheme iron enzyme [Bacteroidales bacterium]|nr:SUMF1/EgtB/PvdO family nonheme iron enzyme [Bacteroidales bacterium]
MKHIVFIILMLLCNKLFPQQKACYLNTKSKLQEENGSFPDSALITDGKRFSSLVIDVDGIEKSMWWIEPRDIILKEVIDYTNTSDTLFFDISQNRNIELSLKSYIFPDYEIRYNPAIYSRYSISLVSSDTIKCKLDWIPFYDTPLHLWTILKNDQIINEEPSIDTTKRKQKPPKTLIKNICGVNFHFVFVEGGYYERKYEIDDTIIVSKEKVNSFYISQYEITNAQWKAIFDEKKTYPCPNCPKVNISWYDALSFISELSEKSKKNFALPSETYWEYAAKGGLNRDTFLYAGSDTLNLVAWTTHDKEQRVHDVYKEQKRPNSLGIYDMTGNVKEWCFDEDEIYTERHYYRGGSWQMIDVQSDAKYLINYRESSGSYASDIGFRIILQVNNENSATSH